MYKTHHPLYNTLRHMKSRCNNPNEQWYHLYGGKGIKVCDRWCDSFWNFLEDMGEKPSPQHSIDRIDSDGDYEPSNCKWSTPTEQSRNTSRNIMITYEGKTKCLTEWVEIFKKPIGVLRRRLDKGWLLKKAFTTEVPKHKRLLKHDGVTDSVMGWAKRTGISRRSIQRRLDVLGWPLKKTLTSNPRIAKTYTHDGKTLTLLEWSVELGVCAATLRSRVNKGWPIEKMLKPT